MPTFSCRVQNSDHTGIPYTIVYITFFSIQENQWAQLKGITDLNGNIRLWTYHNKKMETSHTILQPSITQGIITLAADNRFNPPIAQDIGIELWRYGSYSIVFELSESLQKCTVQRSLNKNGFVPYLENYKFHAADKGGPSKLLPSIMIQEPSELPCSEDSRPPSPSALPPPLLPDIIQRRKDVTRLSASQTWL
ncbi:hypothetical protein BKA67DRAFT_533754 [Truncatella angustata]|uniref:Uncharacterized protein n=1 Tax=Truncatella angustata TaxID=152316 RepID=A0A9P9A1S0_9PEZI|nr:uncharacterized protein BKA67DRAFT_533754 [Truncatella angustata]KAH6658623.1 hypothetical protein BKA67DRAFT_533754 [Truncatella angustata]